MHDQLSQGCLGSHRCQGRVVCGEDWCVLVFLGSNAVTDIILGLTCLAACKQTHGLIRHNLQTYYCAIPCFLISAEYQKAREEKQAAAQASGKRSRIDFTSSSQPTGPSPSQHRGHPAPNKYLGGGVVNKKSRFAPYTGSQPQAGSRWG